ncbi:MAG: YaeQ family protein [Propionivibrio sp.]|uniref:YaeQ family protein n=1 Tax=Propionivibrio sp. TaxID=2212460 RepID=UPI0025E07183|nr:YaeQ family protein [Propionivibrio sp.]MBL0206803.1 YaeQ family protein [Propionivibrio sp.]
MALKATIFKADLTISDIDRNHYQNYTLTLARHPSENDTRMMVRLLAFMRYADEALAFGKGLSSDEEPDLWLKDLTGAIDLWIAVGQPDERWLRKASGRAGRVVVFTYGGRVAEMWWEQNRSSLEKLPKLTVFRLSPESTQALATQAHRMMTLQCTIQDGELMISGLGQLVHVEPFVLMDSGSHG